jgi:hypothetical protein
MKRPTVQLRILSVVILTASFALAQRPLTAAEAKGQVGETATVCGDVVSTRYAATARGKPTFINLDKPYPDQVFTVLIWETDRPKFGDPEQTYRGKHIA